LDSPLYIAAIECAPSARFETGSAADPLTTAAEPRAVEPSRNCTVPVAEAGVTIAVSVTVWLTVEGFVEDVSAVVVAALFTVCASVVDVLDALLASPLYTAVMECAPAVSVDTDSDADPLTTVAEPSADVPSRNCTVPVAAVGVTTAVSVTVWPTVEGFTDDAAVTVVAALFTVSVTMADVLEALLPSPLYTAVMECAPEASVDTDSEAAPLTTVAEPSAVVPSRNCIVPVAEAGVTVAVKLTPCPYDAGFNEDRRSTVELTLFTVCIRTADVLGAVVESPP